MTEKELKRSNEEEEGEKGLTDAELLKQDVVKVCSNADWAKTGQKLHGMNSIVIPLHT